MKQALALAWWGAKATLLFWVALYLLLTVTGRI